MGLRSLHPNVPSGNGIGQTQAFFLHPVISLWVSMPIREMHWVQTPHYNPDLVEFMVPWFAPSQIVTWQLLVWGFWQALFSVWSELLIKISMST